MDLLRILTNLNDIQDFLDMKYRMFGLVVGKYSVYECFG
jgi:hypothetical protein